LVLKEEELARLLQAAQGGLEDRSVAGRKHGLSRERVRQIEKKALRKIRASNVVQQLKVYAN
jgi:DNA-directed RNA polymerase sigma subunit (sigma70/sigma32)